MPAQNWRTAAPWTGSLSRGVRKGDVLRRVEGGDFTLEIGHTETVWCRA